MTLPDRLQKSVISLCVLVTLSACSGEISNSERPSGDTTRQDSASVTTTFDISDKQTNQNASTDYLRSNQRYFLTSDLASLTDDGGSDESVVADGNDTSNLAFKVPVESEYATPLVGIDSFGYPYTGRFYFVSALSTIWDGELVTPRESLISFTDGNTSVFLEGTEYITEDGGIRLTSDYKKASTTCETRVKGSTPIRAVFIGDSETSQIQVCKDGSISDLSWRVEAEEKFARLIVTNTVHNLDRQIIWKTERSITFDTEGAIKGVDFEISNPEISIKLRSP